VTLERIRAFRAECQKMLKDGWYMAGVMLDFLDRLEELEQLQQEKKT
jgi:hypothetical protein